MLREYIMFALIGICSIMMIFSFLNNSMSKEKKKSLFYMALSAMTLVIADSLFKVFNGDTSFTGYWIARLSKFWVFEAFLVIIFLFNIYLKDLFLCEGQLKELPKILGYIDRTILSGTILLVISQFTGIYYSFDSNNIYSRGRWFFISYIFPLLSLVIQLIVIIKYRKHIRKRLFLPILFFAALPIGASVFQFLGKGISITSICIVGMLVLLYCFTIEDTNRLAEIAHKREIDIHKEKEKNAREMIDQSTLALVEAIDAKDKYTNGHSRRVAKYSKMIAERLGKSEEECNEIHLIALLHDVGKIGIPDAIINKTGKLTDEEYDIIKTHPAVGGEILSKIKIAPNLSIGARWHHERYDGKGYPDGLKGEEIPEIARIVAVADSYDAMASKRSYRDALPQYKIRSEFQNGIGTQFDPKFAKVMIDIIDEDVEYKLREN